MRSTMNRMHTARFAQVSCARFACSESTAIMMILDAISASIFALISILSIRLLLAKATRNLTNCQQAPHFA